MTRKNANEAAFASACCYSDDGTEWDNGTFGLTKRELFAAMAMQGLLANPSVDVDSTKLAGMCLLQTDALLAKLEEKKEGKE